MSGFLERLGKLKQTVQEVSANQTRKRKLQPSDEHQTEESFNVQKKIHHSGRPHDTPDLKVKLSFLCIGAQKSGTTWLHVMLKKFPMLSLPDQKEVHFWDWNRKKGLRWYSDQFPQKSKHLLCGEITPCYAILDDAEVSLLCMLLSKNVSRGVIQLKLLSISIYHLFQDRSLKYGIYFPMSN
jgi:hypothetical protein